MGVKGARPQEIQTRYFPTTISHANVQQPCAKNWICGRLLADFFFTQFALDDNAPRGYFVFLESINAIPVVDKSEKPVGWLLPTTVIISKGSKKMGKGRVEALSKMGTWNVRIDRHNSPYIYLKNVFFFSYSLSNDLKHWLGHFHLGMFQLK